MMMTPLRNPSDPNRAEDNNLLRDGRVPHADGFMEWAGLKGKNLYADYEFLCGRHWHYFEDQEHARAAVELVLSYPEQVQDRNEKNASFVGVDEMTGAIYRIEIERKIKSNSHHIRSVFQITSDQYKKIKLEAPRVLQPSQNSFHNNGYKQARTLSSFLRYGTPKKAKVKSDLQKKYNFNGKETNTMQTTPEMYQLSPLELTLSIRAAEAQNSLEYMYLVCKSGTIRPENQLDAMHLTSLLKENPELLANAKTVLEVRRESEFQKFIGKTVEPAAEKTAGQPEVKKEYKSSLLVALKYAVDMAVYRAKAAVMAINNAALKNSLSALEKVQVQVSQLEQLKNRELTLQQQISGEAAPAQIEPSTATAKADDDLLSPKVTQATESIPEKKKSADSAKMKI